MRLQKSFDADVFVDETWDFIHGITTQCTKFLKEMYSGGDNIHFFRGSKRSARWFKQKVRTDRKPMDTPLSIHRDFDSLFMKKFGWPARSSSLFCTLSKHVADSYSSGYTYFIFPIGNYTYIWSDEADDLWLYIQKYFSFIYGIKRRDNAALDFYIDKHGEESGQDEYEKFLKSIVDTYRRGNIRSADEDSEIMLNCKEYYAVSYEDNVRLITSFFNSHKNINEYPKTKEEYKDWCIKKL